MSFARHVFFMNQIYLININSKKLSRWKEKENKVPTDLTRRNAKS